MPDERDILVKQLISSLTTLKEILLKNSDINVRDVLKTAYKTGSANIKFNDDERRRIGSLLKDVIKPIDNCIFNIGYYFQHIQASRNLILRSGLQFMLDNFKTYPVSPNETFEEYLQNTESLQTFDEALEYWKSGDITFTEEDIYFIEEKITRPKNVPKAHTWWL